jgi:hypothetical protein
LHYKAAYMAWYKSWGSHSDEDSSGLSCDTA